uniref:Uncharacterized protein n=1 Tax=Anguilla anguilla TaxID=7936 RepID=A0A0E9XCR0_ANGAN
MSCLVLALKRNKGIFLNDFPYLTHQLCSYDQQVNTSSHVTLNVLG